MFDTYPQEGNWLYVQTNDSSGSLTGYGIYLYDASPVAGVNAGIILITDNLPITLQSGDTIVLQAVDDIIANCDAVTIADTQFLASGPGDHRLVSTGGKAYIRRSDGTYGNLTVQCDQGVISFLLATTPILTVDVTGGPPTYHIITGASWVADL